MAIKLSICISTFNRADFISETIESILDQATLDCEIVIVDGASTDGTEEVVSQYVGRSERLRYVRQDSNGGVDRDFDRAVELASGEYCWLFSDDDVLKPGAIAAVLHAVQRDYSLVLVNGEHRGLDMSNVVSPNFFLLTRDRIYPAGDLDRMFTDLGSCLGCICCVIIKREVWISRERNRYFGSKLVHMGVILQKPLPEKVLVIAEPLMSLRAGNQQTWIEESFVINYITIPTLIWSSALSKKVKEEYVAERPWRRLKYLAAWRAMGVYSQEEYRRWVVPQLQSLRESILPGIIAILPKKLVHRLFVIGSAISGRFESPDDVAFSMQPDCRHVMTVMWNRRRKLSVM